MKEAREIAMNLQHMRYAIAVAQTRSINKAAEKLYVGQPTLSRAIKELEENLGVQLFERSAKGMTLTPDGEAFIHYAKNVLSQVDGIERMFQRDGAVRRRFSLSAPRTGYIYNAFLNFSCQLDPNTRTELFYHESNALNTIQDVELARYSLGVIRYAGENDRYYKELLEEKELACELIAEFHYGLLVGRESPLAGKETIEPEDLKMCLEIVPADSRAPAPPVAEGRAEEPCTASLGRIYVRDGGNPFEMLARNPRTYLWASPVPPEQREMYSLVWREAAEGGALYRDMLIRKKDHVMTRLEKQFIEHLVRSKRETIG